MVNAMLWIARPGAPWRDLPERYGPWETVCSRFRLWKQTGVLDQLLAGLQEGADEFHQVAMVEKKDTSLGEN